MRIFPSRVVAGAAVAALSSVFLIAVPAHATPALTTVTINDTTYTYEDGNPAAGCTITAYSGTATSLWLSDGLSVYGVSYPLTAIGNSAFYEKGLTSVHISPAVTLIDNFAFDGNALTSLSIPSSVVTLGAWAFANNLLTTVTIPDSVTTIGVDVFTSNLLTSVTLGSSVATIGGFAFWGNNLTDITIPASVVSLGDNVFGESSLATVTMLGAAPSTIGLVVFGDGGASPVVSYYARNAGYTAPTWVAGATTYASQALVTVTWYAGVGGGVTTTDEVASAIAAPTAPTADAHRFLGWTVADGEGPALTFPATLAGDTVLYSLWEARAVTSPDSAPAGESFSVSGSGFEPGETVEVSLTPDPALLATLTASGTGTIGATVSLDSATPTGAHQLVFTGSITGATSYDLTVDAVPLPTATVGGVVFEADPANSAAGATVISVGVLGDLATDLVIPPTVVVDGVTYPVTAIRARAFQTTPLTSLTLPESVTTIGDYAFFGDGLTSVTLPDSVTTIGGYAFNGNELTSVTIPASVATLGYQAFGGNPLESVLMQGPVPTSIGNWVFGEPGSEFMLSYYARFPGYTEPTWTAGGVAVASQALATVTFNDGLGTGGTTTDAVVGADLAAPTPPTADGHRFLGWTLTEGSGPVLTFPYALAADDTLYALWEARAVSSPAKAGVGDSFSITGSGFEPGESVEVWLHSDPVLLTTVTASGTGTISASLLLASGTPAGAHQLVFTGTATGTTANDILVEDVLAATGFNAEALALLALELIVAGAALRLAVTVRRPRETT